MQLCALLTIAIGLLCSVASAADDVFSVTYPPSEKVGELAMEATYHVWIPPGVKTIRAVIVHQHGCGEGAEGFGDRAALDLHWRALAARHNAALLSPRYRTDGKECRLWCDPRNGSGVTFTRALRDLAEKSHHPELASVPWCLWGHSGGGFWTSLMLEIFPDRILAAYCRSGAVATNWLGKTPEPHYPPTAFAIPVILSPGKLEQNDPRFDGAWLSTSNYFRAFRAQGAPVAFAPDPFAGHDCRNSRLLAIPFFDACLKARLPRQGNELKQVNLERGWAGDWKTGDIQPVHGKLSPLASWLPDKKSAQAFSEYIRTGKTTDRTSPNEAPVITSIKHTKKGVELTWEPTADFESGIRQFAIYRDGKRIALWPEKLDDQTGFPQFQGISYHDTPVSTRPPLAYTDRTAPSESNPAYSVSLINGAGLESRRSKAARP